MDRRAALAETEEDHSRVHVTPASDLLTVNTSAMLAILFTLFPFALALTLLCTSTLGDARWPLTCKGGRGLNEMARAVLRRLVKVGG